MKENYDTTDFENALQCRTLDKEQWFRLANAPTDEEIESLKKGKGNGCRNPRKYCKLF